MKTKPLLFKNVADEIKTIATLSHDFFVSATTSLLLLVVQYYN